MRKITKRIIGIAVGLLFGNVEFVFRMFLLI